MAPVLTCLPVAEPGRGAAMGNQLPTLAKTSNRPHTVDEVMPPTWQDIGRVQRMAIQGRDEEFRLPQ
jgi:hypothetical protein